MKEDIIRGAEIFYKAVVEGIEREVESGKEIYCYFSGDPRFLRLFDIVHGAIYYVAAYLVDVGIIDKEDREFVKAFQEMKKPYLERLDKALEAAVEKKLF